MRFEYKYLVPVALLPELRECMTPFMTYDPHVRGYEGRGYTVRSIYLDTAGLRFYHEKQEGQKDRNKLRVRAFNTPAEGSPIFLEIKRKLEAATQKVRTPLRPEDLEPLLRTGDVERYVHPTASMPHLRENARRFLYHLYGGALRPAALVVYEREAFEGRFDSTLRITFDRNLRGGFEPSWDRLYLEDGLRPAMPGYFILEVKFNTHFPVWLKPILGRLALRQRALSKYVICLELYEPALHRHRRLPRIGLPPTHLSTAFSPRRESAADGRGEWRTHSDGASCPLPDPPFRIPH